MGLTHIKIGPAGPPGPPGADGTGGDLSYTHTQAVPAASWTVEHGLGKHPAVIVVDSAEEVVIGDVVYLSDTSLRVDFSGAFGGKAYLN